MSIARVALLVAVIAVSAGSALANAVPYILTDGNSQATFNPYTSAGLESWVVDRQEYIAQQWFWYRLGNTAEQPINTLTLDTAATHLSDSNNDGSDDMLYLKYYNNSVRVELTFLLMGGRPGDHTSDMAETIRITNTSTSALDLHFFQFVNFNLTGAGTNDTVQIAGGNTVTQTSTGALVAETVVTPMPSHFQAAIGSAIFDSLNDTGPTMLDDTAGPLGPGDASWAFQWDRTLGAGRSFIISKDKNIVPEPATLALLGAGLITTLLMRRKRR
jgi:hypothetical protein